MEKKAKVLNDQKNQQEKLSICQRWIGPKEIPLEIISILKQNAIVMQQTGKRCNLNPSLYFEVDNPTLNEEQLKQYINSLREEFKNYPIIKIQSVRETYYDKLKQYDLLKFYDILLREKPAFAANILKVLDLQVTDEHEYRIILDAGISLDIQIIFSKLKEIINNLDHLVAIFDYNVGTNICVGKKTQAAADLICKRYQSLLEEIIPQISFDPKKYMGNEKYSMMLEYAYINCFRGPDGKDYFYNLESDYHLLPYRYSQKQYRSWTTLPNLDTNNENYYININIMQCGTQIQKQEQIEKINKQFQLIEQETKDFNSICPININNMQQSCINYNAKEWYLKKQCFALSQALSAVELLKNSKSKEFPFYIAEKGSISKWNLNPEYIEKFLSKENPLSSHYKTLPVIQE